MRNPRALTTNATRPKRSSARQRSTRAGFTLIELIITISIIALLIALLVPAIGEGRRAARVAQVRTEIAGFESAIADFKATFGTELPSSITLSENGNWNADARSKIRAIFGAKFDFTQNYDFNADGMSDADPDMDGNAGLTLDGGQCLLFFLGGPIANDGGTIVPQGFSKNPARPFSIGGTGERVQFLTDLDVSRVHRDAANQYPHYDAPNEYGEYQYVRYTEYADGVAYRQTANSFWKPKSYQIICSGLDGDFGTIGLYDPDNTNALTGGARDNITNFANGTLGN